MRQAGYTVESSLSYMPPQLSETASTADIVGQLAHDLRQPLSSLEAVTYHLEMVLTDAAPEVRSQFERLRQLIDQAGWILDDAASGVQPVTPGRERVNLADEVRSFAAEHAVRDERSLALFIDATPLELVADARVLRRALSTSVQFLRAMALAEDPISLRVQGRGGRAHVIISAQTRATESRSLMNMLDPKTHRTGSLRRLVESMGGALQALVDAAGIFSIEIALPVIH